MIELEPISTKEDKSGLVWHEMATPQYLVELQTSVMPLLLHMVIFDVTDNYRQVHDELTAYTAGSTLDEENMAKLDAAITEALSNL